MLLEDLNRWIGDIPVPLVRESESNDQLVVLGSAHGSDELSVERAVGLLFGTPVQGHHTADLEPVGLVEAD